MSVIALTIDPAGFKALVAKLQEAQRAIPRAIAYGLNDGGDKVRTQVQRALKQQTNVKAYKSITSRVTSYRAFSEGDRNTADSMSGVRPSMTYQIVATGKGIPIEEFPVRDTGHGISAQTWGVDHLFKRSFAIAGRGVDGYRARLTDKREPVRKFYGPSLAKELDSGIVPSVFVLSAAEFVPPAILKRLARVL